MGRLWIAGVWVVGWSVLGGCAAPLGRLAPAPAEKVAERVHPALAMMPVPAGLGLAIHFFQGSDTDYRLMEAAGVGMVRMDVNWGVIEKRPGEYDFGQQDQLVRDLEQRRMRLIFILNYGNSLYDKGLAPHTEEGRAAYARLCSVLARRYAGKAVIWELWNEPNIFFWQPKPNVKDYLAWCKAVVPAIRRADPNACIIGPATYGNAIPFIETCFKEGFLERVDGVSVHPYRGDRFAPEMARREYDGLRALIDRYRPAGKAIPILSGEWGYTTAFISPELQGKYLARQWLSNMVSQVPISIWYDWRDDGPDPKEKEHNFGTLRQNNEPKPAYIAMKTLIEQLRGYRVAGRIPLGDEKDFAVVFRDGDRFKLAIWTTGAAHEVRLPSGLNVTGGVDHLGRVVDVARGSRQRIDDAPRYLSLGAPVPPGVIR